MTEPRWRMTEPRERFPSHVAVTAVRERQVGRVTQVIERVMIQPTSAYERPSYRLLEIEDDNVRQLGVVESLRQARSTFAGREAPA